MADSLDSQPTTPQSAAAAEQAVLRTLAAVQAFIDPRLEAATELSDEAAPRLVAAMRHTLLAPGKRLRPALVLEAARVCGGSWEQAAPAAVAVEMIHAYSLVHDDLPAMDDDDLRRGRPTCHRAFDEATAILCGDALQPLAFATLATHLPEAARGEACRVLAEAAGAEALVGGQADDLAAERGWIADFNDRSAADQIAWMERIHRRKPAASSWRHSTLAAWLRLATRPIERPSQPTDGPSGSRSRSPTTYSMPRELRPTSENALGRMPNGAS